MLKAIMIHPEDNVATVVSDVDEATEIEVYSDTGSRRLVTKEAIPFSHKVAIRPIPEGGDVIKYGKIIGRATKPICEGELVHLHNVVGARVQAGGTR